jgi:hypothetical protein
MEQTGENLQQEIIQTLTALNNGITDETIEAIKSIDIIIKGFDQLKFENANFLLIAKFYLAAISQKAKEQLSTEEIHIQDVMDEVFNAEKFTDEKVERAKYGLNKDFETLLGIKFTGATGVALEIENYLQDIENVLKNRYKFVQSIDKVKLGNFFKILCCLPYKRIIASARLAQEDLDELYHHLVAKKRKRRAPFIENAIKKAKTKYFLDGRFERLKISNEEFLELQIGLLSLLLDFDLKESISNYIYQHIALKKGCEKGCKKGTASLLYGLFRLLPYVRLPSYEEWLLSKEDSNEMDDKNTWALFQKRSIEKIMVLR